MIYDDRPQTGLPPADWSDRADRLLVMIATCTSSISPLLATTAIVSPEVGLGLTMGLASCVALGVSDVLGSDQQSREAHQNLSFFTPAVFAVPTVTLLAGPEAGRKAADYLSMGYDLAAVRSGLGEFRDIRTGVELSSNAYLLMSDLKSISEEFDLRKISRSGLFEPSTSEGSNDSSDTDVDSDLEDTNDHYEEDGCYVPDWLSSNDESGNEV